MLVNGKCGLTVRNYTASFLEPIIGDGFRPAGVDYTHGKPFINHVA